MICHIARLSDWPDLALSNCRVCQVGDLARLDKNSKEDGLARLELVGQIAPYARLDRLAGLGAMPSFKKVS